MNMDRFKFRVWSVEEKSYDHKFPFNSLGIFYIAETGRLFSDFGNSVAPELHEDRFVIEQCTGLKDKNGNLIYEGDIIQNPNKDQYIVEWIVDGYWHIRQIDDEKFGCALASIKTLYDGWEIIGNIHEQKGNK